MHHSEEVIEILCLSEFTEGLENELDDLMREIDVFSEGAEIDDAPSCDPDGNFNIDTDDDNLKEEERLTKQTTEYLLEQLETHSAVTSCKESLTPPSSSEKVKVSALFSPGGSSAVGHMHHHSTSPSAAVSVMDLCSADYTRWSGRSNVTGETHEVLSQYIGLHHSTPSGDNRNESDSSSSSRVGSEYLVHILEIILRPDTPTKLVMVAVAKVAAQLQLKYLDMSPSLYGTERFTHHTKGLNSCSGGSCGHARLSHTTHGVEASESWSYVDVQVCLSTTVMQRVLVCQFISDSELTLPHATSPSLPKSKSVLGPTSKYDPIPPSFPPPTVFQVEKSFRVVFTKYLLSLGCLHALRGSAVRLPLDSSFTGLLEEHYRRVMWEEARKGGDKMQKKLQETEDIYERLREVLLSVYQQHGLSATVSTTASSSATGDIASGAYTSAIAVSDGDYWTDSDSDEAADHNDDDDGTEDNNGDDFEHDGGAMSRCLLAASHTKKLIKNTCRHELAHRLSCRREGVEAAMEACFRRRLALLRHILDSPLARRSSLTKSFVSSFSGVAPTQSAQTLSSPPLASTIPPTQSTQSLHVPISSPSQSRSPPSSISLTPESSSGPVSWISRWIGKENPLPSSPISPPTAKHPPGTSTLGISRWMGRGGRPYPPSTETESPNPPVANEVVLFYCACWQSYSMSSDSAGAGGFLYLTENYVGLVCRSVVGLAKRKELFLLKNLRDVTLWQASSTTHPTHETTITTETVIDTAGKDKETFGPSQSPSSNLSFRQTQESTRQNEGGRILSSLAAVSGLSYLTRGCKLSFSLSPSSCHDESTNNAEVDRTAAATVDVFVVPGSVPASTLQALLLETRNYLPS